MLYIYKRNTGTYINFVMFVFKFGMMSHVIIVDNIYSSQFIAQYRVYIMSNI